MYNKSNQARKRSITAIHENSNLRRLDPGARWCNKQRTGECRCHQSYSTDRDRDTSSDFDHGCKTNHLETHRHSMADSMERGNKGTPLQKHRANCHQTNKTNRHESKARGY